MNKDVAISFILSFKICKRIETRELYTYPNTTKACYKILSNQKQHRSFNTGLTSMLMVEGPCSN